MAAAAVRHRVIVVLAGSAALFKPITTQCHQDVNFGWFNLWKVGTYYQELDKLKWSQFKWTGK